MDFSGTLTMPSTSTMDSLGIWVAYLTMPLLTVVSSANMMAWLDKTTWGGSTSDWVTLIVHGLWSAAYTDRSNAAEGLKFSR